MKILKYVLLAFGILVVIAAAAIAYVSATFDPNQYKPDIVRLVKEKTGRTLAIAGNIGLTFFPRIGVAVGRTSLSEPNGDKQFARIDEARVSLALLPLLSKQVKVDHVVLSGLRLDLVRNKDGRGNFDDLMGGKTAETKPTEASGQLPALDIEGISLKDATIGWRDDTNGTHLKLADAQLDTGRIASGVPGKLSFSGQVLGAQPKMALQVKLAAGYRIDFATHALALSDLELKADGDAFGMSGLAARLKGDVAFDPAKKRVDLAGVELSATTKDGLDVKLSAPKLLLSPQEAKSAAVNAQVKLARGEQKIDARITLSALEATGKALASRLEAEFNVKQGGLSAQGKLATPLALDLEAQRAQLTKIVADLALSSPDMPSLKLASSGQLRVDWGKNSADGELLTKLDDSTIQSKFSVAGFSSPVIGLDVAIDRINVDKYMPPKSAASAEPNKPIDLSALRTLNLNASLRIGALTVQKVKAEKLQLNVRAARGRLDANPLSANLYQGTLAGSASVDANGNRYAAKQQLAGVAIGPLLRDALGKDVLEGRGNVAFDVQSAGVTVAALKKALNGSASVNLKDGAIKGINLAETFRRAKTALGAKSTEQAANQADKTDFSDMTASFVIRNGIAHNEDLALKSPFLRLTGAGDINIGADSIDYLAKASVVNTAAGAGGKELDQLKGLTVPVRLSGPFDALKYRIDFGAMAGEAAKQKVQDKLQEQVGDKLKGLFKR